MMKELRATVAGPDFLIAGPITQALRQLHLQQERGVLSRFGDLRSRNNVGILPGSWKLRADNKN